MNGNSRVHLSLVLLAGLIAAAVACSSKQVGSDVAASVDGRNIYLAELEKYYQNQTSGSEQQPTGEQATSLRLSILRELIDNQILMRRAEKLGLLATDEEVSRKLNDLKSPYSKQEFEARLKEKKISEDDFKRDLRRSLTVDKVLNKEISSKINVSDQDIANYYNAHKSEFNLIEPQYHLAQIFVTTAPGPQVHNLKNDKARNPDEARKKIEAIEGRLKAGEDFAMLAQNYSEDPNTAQSGGDLGFIPESGLEKVNVQIRGMISSLKAGQISPILPAPDGFRILKLISKEPSGQRELSDPRVQQTIREILRNRKDQLLKTAYYEMARNDAKVVNYLARSIIEGTEKPAK